MSNEELVAVVEEWKEEIVRRVALRCNLAKSTVREAIDAGPVEAPEPGPGTEERVAPEDPTLTCFHDRVKWTPDNQAVECKGCGRVFKPGTCVNCHGPAVNENSLSCGRGMQDCWADRGIGPKAATVTAQPVH